VKDFLLKFSFVKCSVDLSDNDCRKNVVVVVVFAVVQSLQCFCLHGSVAAEQFNN